LRIRPPRRYGPEDGTVEDARLAADGLAGP
jgi:hypothetical protein